MGWDAAWETVYQSSAWGRYPPEEVVRFVARHFYKAPDRKNVRILEVGCGPAANLWYIAKEGFSAFGLDGSAEAIKKAGQRLAEEGLKADLKQGDAVRLPYPDAAFDGVLDIECIYANDWKDSERIIREIHRVLKPGGVFFSKTFMTGSHGHHAGRGIARFTSEEEIPRLYGIFPAIEYDSLVRSDQNRQHEIKEWLITCRK
jgi:SAM-dependent methyltransferase